MTQKPMALNWMDAPSAAYLNRPVSEKEAPMPRLLTFVAVVITAIIGVFVFWSSMTPVDELATASGQVIPSGYVQAVQHPDGGIVREILVEDGQIVEPGQALLRLDNTNTQADLGQILSRQKALQLQASRLQRFVAHPEVNKEALTDDEAAILASMETARTTQQNVLKNQIAQKEQELRALSAAFISLQKDEKLAFQEYDMHRSMAEKGIGSRLMAIESERALNQIRAKQTETRIQQNRARDAIRESQNRIQSLNAELKQDAMKTFGQVKAELDEVTESLSKVQAAAERTTIASPVRGIVKGLTVHTLGAVIEPGKVLMDIVPVEKELMVEAMVSPTDIGHLRKGQDVNVKVSAFDFSRYGDVKGKLQSISASTFQTEKGDSFYKIKVGLDKHFVGKDPKRNFILPGMVVQADIVTGKKTVLEYLLKPVHRVADTAFSEN